MWHLLIVDLNEGMIEIRKDNYVKMYLNTANGFRKIFTTKHRTRIGKAGTATVTTAVMARLITSYTK